MYLFFRLTKTRDVQKLRFGETGLLRIPDHVNMSTDTVSFHSYFKIIWLAFHH